MATKRCADSRVAAAKQYVAEKVAIARRCVDEKHVIVTDGHVLNSGNTMTGDDLTLSGKE